MKLFERKKTTARPSSYDREKVRPVIRASICTGEQVAGFKDLQTGKFEEVTVIHTDQDRKEFLRQYGIAESELKKEW